LPLEALLYLKKFCIPLLFKLATAIFSPYKSISEPNILKLMFAVEE